MSTRWYPIYQRGNPQLRVFLPNFWLKLVPSEKTQPKNVVKFHCSIQMTRYDVQNYLEKIYNVKIVDVRTRIKLGEFSKARNRFVVKADDIKVAYAVLHKDEVFEFPNILETEEMLREKKEDVEQLEMMKKGYKDFLKFNKPTDRYQLPGWYSL